jgi:transposase
LTVHIGVGKIWTLELTDAEREQLTRWTKTRTSPHRLVVRSRIVLLASQGLRTSEIAQRLTVAPATVRMWCERFARHGVGILERDAPGRGRRPGMSASHRLAVLQALAHAPPDRRWTARTLAFKAGVSPTTAWRVLKREQARWLDAARTLQP